MTEADKEFIVKDLTSQISVHLPAKKNEKAYRIKYQGELIKTCSGKTVWSTKRAAQNALTLELSRIMGRLFRNKGSWYFSAASFVPGPKEYILGMGDREKVFSLTSEEAIELHEALKKSVKSQFEIVEAA